MDSFLSRKFTLLFCHLYNKNDIFWQTADNDVSFSTYLFQEGFPKLARSVLKRKYANTASHHDAAKMFLLELVDLLAENIPKDIEVCQDFC